MENHLDRVRRDLEARLEELRPVLEEAREIEETLASIDRARATRNAEAHQRDRAPGERRRVPLPVRKRQVLALLREKPDLTTRGMGAELGISGPRIVQVLNALEAEGWVRRAEGEIFVKRDEQEPTP